MGALGLTDIAGLFLFWFVFVKIMQYRNEQRRPKLPDRELEVRSGQREDPGHTFSPHFTPHPTLPTPGPGHESPCPCPALLFCPARGTSPALWTSVYCPQSVLPVPTTGCTFHHRQGPLTLLFTQYPTCLKQGLTQVGAQQILLND